CARDVGGSGLDFW
nr:immunoglobulin heavy chain junction region [Macaca mulatta]